MATRLDRLRTTLSMAGFHGRRCCVGVTAATASLPADNTRHRLLLGLPGCSSSLSPAWRCRKLA